MRCSNDDLHWNPAYSWALLDCILESVQHLFDLLYVAELIGVGMNQIERYCQVLTQSAGAMPHEVEVTSSKKKKKEKKKERKMKKKRGRLIVPRTPFGRQKPAKGGSFSLDSNTW